jgi:hypothetical protein
MNMALDMPPSGSLPTVNAKHQGRRGALIRSRITAMNSVGFS